GFVPEIGFEDLQSVERWKRAAEEAFLVRAVVVSRRGAGQGRKFFADVVPEAAIRRIAGDCALRSRPRESERNRPGQRPPANEQSMRSDAAGGQTPGDDQQCQLRRRNDGQADDQSDAATAAGKREPQPDDQPELERREERQFALLLARL